MEPLESPRVAVVGGVLSRGEDTDGERTDDEVDFPSEPSYVSQHQEEGTHDTATILLQPAKGHRAMIHSNFECAFVEWLTSTTSALAQRPECMLEVCPARTRLLAPTSPNTPRGSCARHDHERYYNTKTPWYQIQTITLSVFRLAWVDHSGANKQT